MKSIFVLKERLLQIHWQFGQSRIKVKLKESKKEETRMDKDKLIFQKSQKVEKTQVVDEKIQ